MVLSGEICTRHYLQLLSSPQSRGDRHFPIPPYSLLYWINPRSQLAFTFFSTKKSPTRIYHSQKNFPHPSLPSGKILRQIPISKCKNSSTIITIRYNESKKNIKHPKLLTPHNIRCFKWFSCNKKARGIGRKFMYHDYYSSISKRKKNLLLHLRRNGERDTLFSY